MSRRIRAAVGGDERSWNDLADASPDSTYCHTWEWIELSEKHLPGRSLRLIAEDRDEFAAACEGTLETVPGSPIQRRLLGRSEFRSPPELTWGYGGPCMRADVRPEVGRELLEEMERRARGEGAGRAWVAPFATRVSSLLVDAGYEVRERLTSLVPLEQPASTMWSRLDASFRRRVRKAESHDLKFVAGKGTDGLPAFLACLKPLSVEKGFPLPPDSFFADLLSLESKRLRAFWHVVRGQTEEPLAASVLIGHKTMITERWAGASPAGKETMANHLRTWRALEWAQEEGFEQYDLGGLPSDPSSGIYQFKQALGGSEYPTHWHVKFLRMRRTASVVRTVRGQSTR